MKKFITMMLTLMIVFSLAACGNSGGSGDAKKDTADNSTAGQEEGQGSEDTASDSDVEYVKDKGTLVVGITNLNLWIIRMIMEIGLVLMRIWRRHLQKAWA